MSGIMHKVLHPFLSLPPPTHQQENELLTHIPPSQTSTTTATTAPSSPTSGVLQPVTLIELFQSQGCNSCPPANAALVARASTTASTAAAELLLTYEVTYWDYLGWADTFGDRRWDARQTAYARALHQRSCYTPQVIVDGGAKPMGSSWRNLGAVLAAAAESAKVGVTVGGKQDQVRFEAVDAGKGVKVVGGKEGRALVLVVFYEAEPKPVRILRGENRGETERYRNVVRDMKLVGTWEGGELVVELPARRKGLEMAVLVQAGNGGQILGAARV